MMGGTSKLYDSKKASSTAERPTSRVPLVNVPALVESSSLPNLDARVFVVINTSSLVGIFVHALLIPIFFWVNQPSLAFVNVMSVVMWSIARHKNREHQQSVAVVLVAIEVAFHAFICVATLGWVSGFQYYLIPLISFLLFYSRGSTALVLSAAAGTISLFVGLFFVFIDQDAALSPQVLLFFQITNFLVPLFTLALISFYYRQASFSAELRMSRLATVDPLTGLLNRRRMLERLSQERGRTDRGGLSFSLVMADIDHFKRVNDTYGHQSGDDVLVEVTGRLRDGLREHDLVSRWGGEEFLMLLPDTNCEGATFVTERLRCAVEAAVVHSRSESISVTASFGVAEYSSGASLSEVMRSADRALYEAKTKGRNRVVVFHSAKDEAPVPPVISGS